MNASGDLDLLLLRRLDGTLDARAAGELDARLARDPEAAQRLCLLAVDQAELLRALHVGAIGAKVAGRRAGQAESVSSEHSRRGLWTRRGLGAAAGAAAAFVLAAGAWLLMGGAGPTLESGQLLADGRPTSNPREEQRLEAVGGPAVLRLGDGSRVELAEESVARLKAPTEGLRQLVALDEGEGRFKVAHGGGRFRVETPAGRITVLGTEFTVRVPGKLKAAAPPNGEAQAFRVTVHDGRVQLDHEGREILLVAGQSFTSGGGVQVARPELPKRPAAAPNPASRQERAAKAEIIEITGILHAAFGDGPDAAPEFITLTTADATVYKLEVNAAAALAAKDFDGQEVTLSGTLRAVDGIDWFTIGEADEPGAELHTGGPDNPQGVEGKDDRLKRRPAVRPADGARKPKPERKPAGRTPVDPAE